MGKQKITAAQKQHIQQFQGITGATKDQAIEWLQATQWNVEVAINHFFNAGLTGAPPKDNSAVVSLYERYKDQSEDAILAEGISSSYFCSTQVVAAFWAESSSMM